MAFDTERGGNAQRELVGQKRRRDVIVIAADIVETIPAANRQRPVAIHHADRKLFGRIVFVDGGDAQVFKFQKSTDMPDVRFPLRRKIAGAESIF